MYFLLLYCPSTLLGIRPCHSLLSQGVVFVQECEVDSVDMNWLWNVGTESLLYISFLALDGSGRVVFPLHLVCGSLVGRWPQSSRWSLIATQPAHGKETGETEQANRGPNGKGVPWRLLDGTTICPRLACRQVAAIFSLVSYCNSINVWKRDWRDRTSESWTGWKGMLSMSGLNG